MVLLVYGICKVSMVFCKRVVQCSIVYCLRWHNGRIRPYQHDSTASRPLSEGKHVRAWLVLRWRTTVESQVLYSFSPNSFFKLLLLRDTINKNTKLPHLMQWYQLTSPLKATTPSLVSVLTIIVLHSLCVGKDDIQGDLCSSGDRTSGMGEDGTSASVKGKVLSYLDVAKKGSVWKEWVVDLDLSFLWNNTGHLQVGIYY